MTAMLGFLVAGLLLGLPAYAGEKAAALDEGKKLYDARCSVCHSHRYIEMQPRRSREDYAKFWPAEITKMINAYGASEMSQDEMRKLAEYLTHVKGGND